MARPLVTVSLLCLLCASHVCTEFGHVHIRSLRKHYESFCHLCNGSSHALSYDGDVHRRIRETPIMDAVFYLHKILDEFGDGNKITMEGFLRMMTSLSKSEGMRETENDGSESMNELAGEREDLDPPEDHIHEQSLHCLSAKDIFNKISENVLNDSRISAPIFHDVCPILLYKLLMPECTTPQETTLEKNNTVSVERELSGMVWVCSIASILVVSLCGALSVAVIPLINHNVYVQMIQFLVALAVGTLIGDALMHLFPHAMLTFDDSKGSTHHAHTQENEDLHTANVWRGFLGCIGIVFLFSVEKLVTIMGEKWRNKCKKKKSSQSSSGMRNSVPTERDGVVGEKLCKHTHTQKNEKKYPYGYGEINTNEERADDSSEVSHTHIHHHSRCVPEDNMACMQSILKSNTDRDGATEAISDFTGNTHTHTVIVREHESGHHGHSHKHLYASPKSISSVAWMVIFGDGIHNITDGMAIGAAFAANLAGGLSTSIAVFCHEFPHELGDFAMLLKAGMSPKQALLYNLLSSVLSFIGMVIGVFLGHSSAATPWVFSAAGGMFLYIGLVDMIPELTSSHHQPLASAGETCSLSLCFSQSLLHILGLLSGITIMLVIALYEDDLLHLFSSDEHV